jgi:glycosyltransferase involved in cell wall biosynthesis
MIDVCICTHNPRRDLLDVVIDSIARQDVPRATFRVLLVDNASKPPIPGAVLEPLRRASIEARLVVEPVPGTSRARMRAVTETDGDWILFVDDDNELAPGYVGEGLAFIARHPEVGCFGGKLLLAQGLEPPSWVVPFLPYLGIKDMGDETVSGKADKWERWEPPTAGAFVCRRLLGEYRRQSEEGKDVFKLGAQGAVPLRCEDSLIMRNAYPLGLANAYYPRLALQHHLDPSRFRFRYLVRLLYGYGVSHVILESILKGPQPMPAYYASLNLFMRTLYWVFRQERRHSLAYGIGQVAYHVGARAEHLRQARRPQG